MQSECIELLHEFASVAAMIAGKGSFFGDDERNWSRNGEAASHAGLNALGDDVVFGRSHGGVINLGQNNDCVLRSLDDYDLIGEDVSLNVTSGEVSVDDDSSLSIMAFVHSTDGRIRKVRLER